MHPTETQTPRYNLLFDRETKKEGIKKKKERKKEPSVCVLTAVSACCSSERWKKEEEDSRISTRSGKKIDAGESENMKTGINHHN